MSGSHSPTRVSDTDASAEYFLERTGTIREHLRTKRRSVPRRYAEPPECDLPEDIVPTAVTVPVAGEDLLDASERQYMEKLRSRQLGENEAAVFACLGEGRAAALTSRKIEELTHLSARAIRSAVETLRINGFPICSATGGRKRSRGDAGYWRAGTGEEFVACIKANRRRALRQLAVTGAMKRAALELFGQTVFELDEAEAVA